MLGEVFYWLFNMSIVTVLTGLPVLLIRQIKRIPKRVTVFLWAIPFLRMVVPFGLGSPYSLLSPLSGITAKTVVVHQFAEGLPVTAMNYTMGAKSYFPITYRTEMLEQVFSVASVLWVIVAVAVMLMLAVTYGFTIYEVQDATHLQGRVFLSEKVLSPAVYGILKPKIILPASYENRDTELIVLHETTHIRRLDNLWRMLGFAAVAVHWFNPVCWLFLKCFLSDLELACDERVVAKIGAQQAKKYASVLLDCKQGTTVFASAFGGAKIRTRIENILSFKKMTRFSAVVSVILLSVIFYVLLTNAE